ncbi:uncharacterized protein [Arachis hypogaea]|uniref:uncharacterized protein n=1 Tax=Arachis hypogaea TaxID=3818 RepID=UPI000DED1ED2|nr:uncharacterized protein LOC112701718 [Arachis hypogaea]
MAQPASSSSAVSSASSMDVDPYNLSPADQPNSVAELWNDLKEHFQHENGPRMFELKRDLMNLRQGAMFVSRYFTRIKVLWEELNSYRPVQCNCGDARAMQEFLQAEYIHCFLMGLDESFSQIRGQISLLEPLPTINKVLFLVTQEEKHRAIGASLNSASQNQVAFLARNQQPPQSQGRCRGMVKKDRPLCSYCEILGHTINKCYKIHGYPPNFGKGRNMKPSVHHVSTSQSTSDAQISPNLTPTQVQ